MTAGWSKCYSAMSQRRSARRGSVVSVVKHVKIEYKTMYKSSDITTRSQSHFNPLTKHLNHTMSSPSSSPTPVPGVLGKRTAPSEPVRRRVKRHKGINAMSDAEAEKFNSAETLSAFKQTL
ncbi:hypothetical protein FRC08_016565 [Ceratobasidium sp. 394]|nr:hypothetical protein FRC08_016565 [Ceratobasidium sp. 394]